MSCTECKLEKRVDILERDIENMQSIQNSQSVSIGKIEAYLEGIIKTLGELKEKVEGLSMKTGKRVDMLIDKAISGVVAAIVAAAMAKLIIGG